MCRHNEPLDLKLEAQKHALSHTCSPAFRQADTHRHTVSSLSDRDSCLGCFGASHSPPPSLPLPGPSEPQLSVPGVQNSVWGRRRPRGPGNNGLHLVAIGERLLGCVRRRLENAGARDQVGW